MRSAGDKSTAAWRDVIQHLVERPVAALRLAMIDGSAGLAALREPWPTLAMQRCTAHKPRISKRRRRSGCAEELAEA
jgi:transposase-like protein